MEFKFNVYSFKFTKAMNNYPKNLVKHLTRGSKRSASLVEDYARQNHRFTTREGDLVKSIIASALALEVKLKLQDEGEPFGTKYGKYVHDGQRSWGADKFIPMSMERNKKQVFRNWERAIDEANKEF